MGGSNKYMSGAAARTGDFNEIRWKKCLKRNGERNKGYLFKAKTNGKEVNIIQDAGR